MVSIKLSTACVVMLIFMLAVWPCYDHYMFGTASSTARDSGLTAPPEGPVVCSISQLTTELNSFFSTISGFVQRASQFLGQNLLHIATDVSPLQLRREILDARISKFETSKQLPDSILACVRKDAAGLYAIGTLIPLIENSTTLLQAEISTRTSSLIRQAFHTCPALAEYLDHLEPFAQLKNGNAPLQLAWKAKPIRIDRKIQSSSQICRAYGSVTRTAYVANEPADLGVFLQEVTCAGFGCIISTTLRRWKHEIMSMGQCIGSNFLTLAGQDNSELHGQTYAPTACICLSSWLYRAYFWFVEPFWLCVENAAVVSQPVWQPLSTVLAVMIPPSEHTNALVHLLMLTPAIVLFFKMSAFIVDLSMFPVGLVAGRLYGQKLLSVFDYGVSPEKGFLGSAPPIERLPNYFLPWEQIMDQLPILFSGNSSGQGNLRKGPDHPLRVAVEQLPLLDATRLETLREMQRAHAVLSILANAYVWADESVEDSDHARKRASSGYNAGEVECLPYQLATPLLLVSYHPCIQQPPIICHSSGVLFNWKQPKESDFKNRDMHQIPSYRMTNRILGQPAGASEHAFWSVTAQMEHAGGWAVHGCEIAFNAAIRKDERQCLKGLTMVQESLLMVTKLFSRMFDECHPDHFYFCLRPFLAGWPSSGKYASGMRYELPPGPISKFDDCLKRLIEQFSQFSISNVTVIRLEGVEARIQNGRPIVAASGDDEDKSSFVQIKCEGASAAQSSLFQLLDGLLGVKHSSETGNFLKRMRAYMPKQHREMVEFVHLNSRVGSFVQGSKNRSLKSKFQDVVRTLLCARKAHVSAVHKYILKPSSEMHIGTGSTGTGGTDVLKFLGDVMASVELLKQSS